MKQPFLEPLLFTPALKERVWGGACRKAFLTPEMTAPSTKIGEYWQIYDRPEDSARISCGAFKDKTLHDLIAEYGTESLIGPGFHGTLFPVMIKVLDAKENLSLQVHPGKNNPFGEESKAEFWYPLKDCNENAGFIAGTKKDTAEQDFWNSVYDADKLMQMLLFYPLGKNHSAACLIRPGCIHALCKNSVVLEVQENSDTTYRISDWGRKAADGSYRELHLEKAKQTVDFNLSVKYILDGENTRFCDDGIPFTAKKQTLRPKGITWDTDHRSFHILSVISGNISLRYRDQTYQVKYGGCILIPACCGSYEIASAEETAEVLCIQIVQ